MSGRLSLLLALRARTFLRSGGRGWRKALPLFGLLMLGGLSTWLAAGAVLVTRDLAARSPELLPEWVHLSFLFVWVSLVLLPLLGFAGSDFGDVSKVYHLPVRPRTVLLAHTLAQFGGGFSLFFLPLLAGISVSLPGGAGLTVLRLGLSVLFLLHAAILGQALRLLFLHTLRSRRFRDLAAILAAVFTAVVYVSLRLLFAGPDATEAIRRALSAGVSAWLVPLPPLWLSAGVAPGAGAGQAALIVFGFVPLNVLLVPLAAVLMDRAFYSDVPVALPRRATVDRGANREAPRGLGFLPASVRAVAGHQLTLLRREPSLKAMLIQQSIFVLLPAVLVVVQSGEEARGEITAYMTEWWLYLLLFIESTLAFDLFGLDGPGITHLLVAPVPRRRLLLGKLLAHLLLFFVLNALLFAGLLAFLAWQGMGLAAGRALSLAALWVAGLLALLGVGAVVSVLAPYPIGATSRRAVDQAGRSRGGCLRVGINLTGVLAVALLLAPMQIFLRSPGAAPLVVAVGAGLFLLGLRAGERLLRTREEKLLGAFLRAD
jgi:hypothetical protein